MTDINWASGGFSMYLVMLPVMMSVNSDTALLFICYTPTLDKICFVLFSYKVL